MTQRKAAARKRAPEAIAAIAKGLKPLMKETWLLTPARKGGKHGLRTPLLGGTPYAEAGETWPVDPTTGEPMKFVLQFMAERVLHVVFVHDMTLVETDLHLVDGTGGILVRRYRTPSEKRRTALAVPKGMRKAPQHARIARVPCLPSWEEVGPAMLRLCRAADPDAPWKAYARAQRKLGVPEFDINGTKLFGYQSPYQDAIAFRCPDCRRNMEFLAQTVLRNGVTLNIYLLRCARHRHRIAGAAQYS